jgi:hypothetical protein
MNLPVMRSYSGDFLGFRVGVVHSRTQAMEFRVV